MKLYNTKTRQVEEFVPYHPKQVTMYTCGPTVYHYAHIGNLRTYIMEDVLEKTLRKLGYSVKRAMNITDVGHLSSDSDSGEDKMLKGAKREKKSVLEIAEMYTDAFFSDCEKLRIKKPSIISPATHNISEYIHIIEKLLELGKAYVSNGNVYFDVSQLDDYYCLTNHKEDEMVVGIREGVLEDPGKRNQADFVLWFTKSKFDDQELKWDSPWGVGYPGWHIECSGISIKYLGEYLDIHCGGVDNIFPHHTNEIAQSEGFLGHPWCKYWVHGEHLNDQSGKMSKSSGEFLTLSLLEEKGYEPLVYRYFCLGSHYRRQLVFSYDSMDTAKVSYQKLRQKIQGLTADGELQDALVAQYETKFLDALADDLNTANALTILYEVLKSDTMNHTTKLYLIRSFDEVLSLDLIQDKKAIDDTMKQEIEELIRKRDQYKKEKNYVEADRIRDELKERGIQLIDRSDGTTFELLS